MSEMILAVSDEAPDMIETGSEVLQQVGNFVAVQTVNVLNSSHRLLDWYLSKAAENPFLGQVTKAIHGNSLLMLALAGDKIDWKSVIGATVAGIVFGGAGGLLRARLAERLAVQQNPQADGAEVERRQREEMRMPVQGSLFFGAIGFLGSLLQQ